jgi:hypothetical protein
MEVDGEVAEAGGWMVAAEQEADGTICVRGCSWVWVAQRAGGFVG